MKRITLVIAVAFVLTFAFATNAFATTGKFFANSTSYYQWNKPAVIPPGTASPAGLFDIGDNPANPGVHANYLATTAKCGICHSVHRAAADGVKLLPVGEATCAGCHTGGTAITNKIVTWTPYDIRWVPVSNMPGGVGGTAWMAATPGQRSASITNKAAAGGAANGGGPHNDSALDLVADGIWDGTGATPEASYEIGRRYGCFTRRCHATNPHGANSSKYTIFAAKLLFNDSPAQDDASYPELLHENGAGTYGGLDASLDGLGATDASVVRFVKQNSSIMSTVAAAGGKVNILIEGVAPDTAETHALVSGLTCGRPSNPNTGEDECHAEAAYAIVNPKIVENRNHGTGITAGALYRTDNTGGEALGYGGNDNRDLKTGHVAGTFGVDPSKTAYAKIDGCTSCHDQTDAANGTDGHFTFPHGQVAAGASNLTTDGVNPLPAKSVYDPTGPGIRSRIWAGYAGKVGAPLTYTAGTNQKAYDGQCLKCHRKNDGTRDVGIGITK